MPIDRQVDGDTADGFLADDVFVAHGWGLA